MGVVIPAMLPNRLNMPPFRPTIPLGEVSETTVHPSAPKPLPKKANDIRTMICHCLSTTLQSIIVMASAIPTTIGAFLEKLSEQPERSQPSDATPPSTPPAAPHSAGNAPATPALVMDMCRA